MASGTLTWRRLCKMAVILFECGQIPLLPGAQTARVSNEDYCLT